MSDGIENKRPQRPILLFPHKAASSMPNPILDTRMKRNDDGNIGDILRKRRRNPYIGYERRGNHNHCRGCLCVRVVRVSGMCGKGGEVFMCAAYAGQGVNIPIGRSCLIARFKTQFNPSQNNWPAHIVMTVSSRV